MPFIVLQAVTGGFPVPHTAEKSCPHILQSFALLLALYPAGGVFLLADLQRPVSARTGGFVKAGERC